jgi:hypothetical protein
MINRPLHPRHKVPPKHLQTSPTCTAPVRQEKLLVISLLRTRNHLAKSGSLVGITNQMLTQVEQHCKLLVLCKKVQLNKAHGNSCIRIEAQIKLIEAMDTIRKVNKRATLKYSLWTRIVRINTPLTPIRISITAFQRQQISKTKCTSKEVISAQKLKEQAQQKYTQIRAAQPKTSPKKTN